MNYPVGSEGLVRDDETETRFVASKQNYRSEFEWLLGRGYQKGIC